MFITIYSIIYLAIAKDPGENAPLSSLWINHYKQHVSFLCVSFILFTCFEIKVEMNMFLGCLLNFTCRNRWWHAL